MFRRPTDRERRAGRELIGKRVKIFWDGDNSHYEAVISSYNPLTKEHCAVYTHDSTVHNENLATSEWMVWDEASKRGAAASSAMGAGASSSKASGDISGLLSGSSSLDFAPTAVGSSSISASNAVLLQRQEEQDRCLNSRRDKRDDFFVSLLECIRPFVTKKFLQRLEARRTLLSQCPAGPLPSESAASPTRVRGMENLLTLILLGVVPHPLANYVCFNPGALTIAGTFVSEAPLPPLRMRGSHRNELDYGDKDIINHFIVNSNSAPFTSATFHASYQDVIHFQNESKGTDAFFGYRIVWPGNRLPSEIRSTSISEIVDAVIHGNVDIDWSNVYFLGKPASVEAPPSRGKNGSISLLTDNQSLRYKATTPLDEISVYVTALRLATGEFVPHSEELFPFTSFYAKRDTIPISNLVSISYMCPHTKTLRRVFRQYCDARHYSSVFDKVVNVVVKKNPEAKQHLAERGGAMIAGLQSTEDAVSPKPATEPGASDPSKPDVFENIKMIDVSSDVRLNLAYHQIQGISWLTHMFKNGVPSVVTDDRILGREVQIVGFISYVMKRIDTYWGPFLIVCPSVSVMNWTRIIASVNSRLKFRCYHGSKLERQRIKRQWETKYVDVVITTYRALAADASFMAKHFWTGIVVDGDSIFKDDSVALRTQLANLRSSHRVVVCDHMDTLETTQLWNLANFVAPDVFTEEVRSTFATHTSSDVERLRSKLVSSFLLHRKKSDVYPVAAATAKFVEMPVFVPMTPKQVECYEVIRQSLQTASAPLQHSDVTNALSSFQAICNHTMLYTGFDHEHVSRDKFESYLSTLKSCSGKLMVLDSLLQHILDSPGSHSVLIVCQSPAMSLILEDFCVFSEYIYVRYSEGASKVQRRLDVRNYLKTNCSVFVNIADPASIKNVVVDHIDNIILFETQWNNSSYAHIREQLSNTFDPKRVHLYKFLSAGTIEEALYHESKAAPEISPYDQVSEELLVQMATFRQLELLESEEYLPEDAMDVFSIRSESPSDAEADEEKQGAEDTAEFVVPAQAPVEAVRVRGSHLLDQPLLFSEVMKPVWPEAWGPSFGADLSNFGHDAIVRDHLTNQPFCCLCSCKTLVDEESDSSSVSSTSDNESRAPNADHLMMCTQCPLSFHSSCFENLALPSNLSTFEDNTLVVCPQHKCVCGEMSGVNFPCGECLTMYCEKCLPELDVESVGLLGEFSQTYSFYHRKRYYIRCEACCNRKKDSGSGRDSAGEFKYDSYGDRPRRGENVVGDFNGDGGVFSIVSVPTQTVHVFTYENELPMSGRKRKVANVARTRSSIEREMESKNAASSQQQSEDTVTLYPDIILNSVRVSFPHKKFIPSNSTMTFSDLLKKISKNSAEYESSDDYNLVVYAYLDKEYSSDTRILCELADEVVGAISLGYKYIRFEVTHTMVQERKRRG